MANDKIDALFGAATTSATDGQLQRIRQLLAEESDTKAELDTANAMVTAAKERLNELYHARLPEALQAAGVANFTADNGLKVSLEFSVDGALGSPKTEEEFLERERKIDVLDANGAGEIIKMTVSVSFGKDDYDKAQQLLDRLREEGYPAEKLRTIHHQTLKKWIKERMEQGADLPLDDLGIWYGQIAKVSRPRGSS